MTLSKPEIQDRLDFSNISGFNVERQEGELSIEPSSIDLHLGKEYGWYKLQKRPIEVDREETYPTFRKEEAGSKIAIKPGEFILGHTQEIVDLPNNIVGYLQGRSSVGRLGLFVENAGLVDAGFQGDLTLELYNSGKNTIVLKPGMKICQLTLHEHDYSPKIGYSEENGNKYQGQRGPTPSCLYQDFE